MQNDLKLITDLTDALNALIRGEKSSPVVLPENYPDNEIRALSGTVNEIIEKINIYTESLFSLSNGDLSHEIPNGKMKIHDALKNLQANLSHLTWKTQRIAQGDFLQTIDFMGEFSNAFNSMTKQLKQAFETIEAQNIKFIKKDNEITRDLKLAAAIQKTLISDSISVNGVNIHAIYKPMILIGGDFYTFVEFREKEKFGVFIADVNGHGVNAALITGILKVLIDSAGDISRDPSGLLYYINSRIVDLGLDIYFTALYGICDIHKKEIIFARGGHNHPYLVNRKNEASILQSEGPMLGVSKDIIIENKSAPLDSGDKIVIYTDGLSETKNFDGNSFESTGLLDALNKNSDMNIKNFLNAIYAELIYFKGSEKFDDDVCILGIEIL